MAKVVRAYCRVSTDLIAQETSLENQETRIRLYCIEHGYNLVKIYKEAISGKNTNRPQLQLLLDEVQSSEVVIVCDISRLSRSTVDGLQLIERFQKMKVGFVSISQQYDTTTPMGEVMLTVQMSFNQYERKNTALKVKGAMQTLSKEGKLRSRPPFGWKFAGKENDFLPELEQQRVLDKIKQLHNEGATTTAIAKRLNDDGDHQCIGNNKKNAAKFVDARFDHTMIKRILQQNQVVEGAKKTVTDRIVSHRK